VFAGGDVAAGGDGGVLAEVCEFLAVELPGVEPLVPVELLPPDPKLIFGDGEIGLAGEVLRDRLEAEVDRSGFAVGAESGVGADGLFGQALPDGGVTGGRLGHGERLKGAQKEGSSE
jgi:hypothetical protein